VKRIQSRQQEEQLASTPDSASVRYPSTRRPLMRPRRTDEARRYRLTWRRGPRRAQRDQTWENLSRGASVAREAASRNAGITTDPCGVATLVVESRGERAPLWRNWQAHYYPFVCALLDELGKPNPFSSLATPKPRASSPDQARRGKRVTRRQRSVRS